MILRFIFQFRYCVRAGIRLHDRMFKSILHTTVRFFDVNPVGKCCFFSIHKVSEMCLIVFPYKSYSIRFIKLISIQKQIDEL